MGCLNAKVNSKTKKLNSFLTTLFISLQFKSNLENQLILEGETSNKHKTTFAKKNFPHNVVLNSTIFYFRVNQEFILLITLSQPRILSLRDTSFYYSDFHSEGDREGGQIRFQTHESSHLFKFFVCYSNALLN